MRLVSLLIVFFLGYSVIVQMQDACAEDRDSDSTDLILDSAETFFTSLKNSDYDRAWNFLSKESHETIINDVYQTTVKISRDIKRQGIAEDFRNNGVLSMNYWRAFLSAFDIDMILEQSLWEMGHVKQNKAEIILTYKKSTRPTRMKMYREQDEWKLGLVETFWPRKKMKLLDVLFQLMS